MPKWLHAVIGIVVIAVALGALVVLNDGGNKAPKSSSSSDDPPKTNYNDDPGAKGLKIPSSN